MNIIIHNNNLSNTGGPRVILSLAKEFANRGHNVSILVESKYNIAFDVPPEIKVYHLSNTDLKLVDVVSTNTGLNTRSLRKNMPLFIKKPLLKIKSVFENYCRRTLYLYGKKHIVNELRKLKPDVIINNNIYFNLFYNDMFSSVSRTIIWMHNSPIDVYSRPQSPKLSSVRRFYNGKSVVGVSKRTVKELSDLDINPFEKRSIYNAFDFNHIRSLAQSKIEYKLPERYIVIVGTLCKRKRVDRAIKAMKHFDSSVFLVICGDGELYDELQQLAVKLGLEDRIIFHGFISNPYPIISNAECLLLTSDSEGLPTVIIESMILKTPVVSVNCPTGPDEILTGDLSKFLVPFDTTEDDIPKAIYEKFLLIPSINLLDFDDVLLKFRGDVVVDKWLEVLERNEYISS